MASVLHGKVQMVGDYRSALGESPIWCDWSATNYLYEIAAEKTRNRMIIGTTFLTLIDTIGSPNTFWLYGVLNVVFIVLTVMFVPETCHWNILNAI